MEPGHFTFPHDADVGVRGVGHTPAEALANAGLALTSVLTDPRNVRPLRAFDVALAEDDPELLLYAWLSELITRMDTERMLFSRFEVETTPDGLRARIWGEPIDPARHEPAVEVKAATFDQLRLEEHDGLWLAQAVVDV